MAGSSLDFLVADCLWDLVRPTMSLSALKGDAAVGRRNLVSLRCCNAGPLTRRVWYAAMALAHRMPTV